MPLEIDPSKTGLEKVLKDYQIKALELLWNGSEVGLVSREVHEGVNEALSGGSSISRASIINFLNAMCEEGVLRFMEETGKGGIRRRYHPAMDKREFKVYIAVSAISSLMRDFPEQTFEVAQKLT